MRFARYPAALCRGGVAAAALAFALLATGGQPGCRRRPGPAPIPTAPITGRVLNGQGSPIGGATIALTADPDDGRVPYASTRTTAAGGFRVEGVPAGGYRLRARAPGYVEGLARIKVASGSDPPIELRLAPTVLLAGQIQDQRGTPVPLARVLAFAVAEAAAPQVHETRADEHGAFRLPGLGPGAHRLLIEAPGLGTASAGPVRAPDEHVVVVLPGEIRAIVGRVTRDGQPAPGARVLLGGEAVTEPRSVVTDADGQFAFAGLGPGSYALRAEAGGLIAPVMAEIALDRASSQTRRVELALAPGAFARGRVIGEVGQPVGGATVQIDLVPATGLWPPVSTDSDGNWSSAPLGAGVYRVRARHPGFVARRTATVEVKRAAAPPASATSGVPRAAAASAPAAPPTAPSDPPPVVLELVRTGTLSGRVIDDRGAPVPGATVHDRLAETEELGVIWSRLPLAAEAAALPSGAVLPSASSGPPASRRAITDATGRFVLGDVPPGRVRVEVLNPSSVPLRTAPVTLTPGGLLDLGTLKVSAAVQVRGRVVDQDGRPLANVHVVAKGRSLPDDAGAGLYAMTDGEGDFSLPLPAGEHQLTASSPGRPEASASVRVDGPGPPAPVTIRLANTGAGTGTGDRTVAGVVRDAEKRPLARARIAAALILALPVVGGDIKKAEPVATTTADAGGRFRLTGLSAGAFSLEVRHADYAPYRQVVDLAAADSQPKAVELQVPLPGGIDGEVHERITGAPVPGFQIDARGPDGASARFPEAAGRLAARASGPLRFSLRRLTPGRWTLNVRATGYQPLEHVVQVGSASVLGEASVRDLRLEAQRL